MYIDFLKIDLDVWMIVSILLILYLFITSAVTWIWYRKSNLVQNKNKDLVYTNASSASLNIDEDGEFEVDLNTLVPDSNGTVQITL